MGILIKVVKKLLMNLYSIQIYLENFKVGECVLRTSLKNETKLNVKLKI